MTTTTQTTPTTNSPSSTARRPVLPTAALTTGAALAANMAVYGSARASGVRFQFPQPGSANATQTATAGAVAVFTLMAMIIGWAIAALAASHRRPTLRTMAIIGAGISVVSTLAPLTLDTGASVKLTLASPHLIAGGLYVAGIAGLRRATTGATR
jgi:putative copper export protein